MQEHTNEELAALIRQGRTECMAELWEQVRRLIMKMIFQLLKKRPLPAWADTEDAVQCGFFALVKSCGSVSAGGWIPPDFLPFVLRAQCAEFRAMGPEKGSRGHVIQPTGRRRGKRNGAAGADRGRKRPARV